MIFQIINQVHLFEAIIQRVFAAKSLTIIVIFLDLKWPAPAPVFKCQLLILPNIIGVFSAVWASVCLLIDYFLFKKSLDREDLCSDIRI